MKVSWIVSVLLWLILGSRLAVALPPQPAGSPEPVLTLGELLAEAQQANPEIQEMQAMQEMARARVPQAGTLPDPMFGIGYRNNGLRLNLGSDPFSNLVLSLSQQFPFPGKLGLKREVAQRELERVEAEVAVKRLNVAAMLKETYYELYYVYRAADLTRQNRDLLRQFAKIAARKYAVGQISQVDVLRAQVQVAKMTQELVMLEQQNISLKAEINRLLNRPPSTTLGRPAALTIRHRRLELEALLALADKAPRLQVVEQDNRRARAALASAQKDYYPDFTTMVMLMPRGAMASMWEVNLNMNLPIFFASRQDEAVREMGGDLHRTRARQQSERQAIAALLRDRLTKVETTMQLEEIYRTAILPQARATQRAATAGYMVGKVDFLTLLDSAMAVLNFEKELVRAVVDHHHALTHIEEAIGGELGEE